MFYTYQCYVMLCYSLGLIIIIMQLSLPVIPSSPTALRHALKECAPVELTLHLENEEEEEEGEEDH